MSASPQTPRHSPRPSMEFQTSTGPPSRRQSKSSFRDPGTPLRDGFAAEDISMLSHGGMSGMGMGMGGGASGLGNLADELADAFSEDEDGDEERYDGEDGSTRANISFELDESGEPQAKEGQRDSGVDVESPTAAGGKLELPLRQNGRGHRRKGSEYDGSQYGSDSDLETPEGMPTSLVARIDAIDSLARRGLENNGSPSDGACKRLTDGLRDLGSQANVEGNATRLITAHSALTTHLSHQSGQLHKLTFPLLSPLAPAPDPDAVDGLIPMLAALAEAMPRPPAGALGSLAALHQSTADLAQTLDYLSDTLHMSRQATQTAARRLRAARELVAEMRRDADLRDEAAAWVERERWQDRLRRRECAAVCRDVVGGFEEVCNGWRRRLMAQETESA